MRCQNWAQITLGKQLTPIVIIMSQARTNQNRNKNNRTSLGHPEYHAEINRS